MPTIYTYDPNVPASGNAPKNDQPTMQQNAASIQGLITVDHVNFGTSENGYHKVIHFKDQGSDPLALAGYGQTYTKTVSGDQQLFYESGGGIVTQLTSLGKNTSGNFGYTSLPGGIILQWGFITIASDPHPYVFSSPNISFPTRCANVSLTLDANTATSSTNNAYVIGTPTVNGFDWGFTGTTSYQYIYWIAIGF